MAIIAGLAGKRFVVRVPGDYAWEQATQRFGAKEGVDEFQSKKYGLMAELLRWIQKFVVKKADKVITPSFYFKNIVSGWIGGSDKVEAIYNGIDLSSNQASSAEKPKDHSLKRIFSAGRLVPWKGFATLIKIMKDLPEWRLVIAGDGPMKNELKTLVKSLGLEERVKMTGALSREKLLSELKISDLFILNTSFESFSFQTVEAMHLGVPVITTNIGNLKEIVEDGKEGILVEPDNEEQLLQAIKKIDEDEKFRNLIIQNTKKKSGEFSIDKTLNHLENVMAKL